MLTDSQLLSLKKLRDYEHFYLRVEAAPYLDRVAVGDDHLKWLLGGVKEVLKEFSEELE